MNCKPGDLAVIVKSFAGNEGKIVRCLRLATESEIKEADFRPMPIWVIDRPLRTTWGFHRALAADEFLRPIRPSEGDDETLTWAGKPEQVTA